MEKIENWKETVIETLGNCKTKAELAAAQYSFELGLREAYNLRVSEARKEMNDKTAYLAGASAARHGEICYENRQQWKQDRAGMWEEAANTSTPPTIAAILHAAKQRGILESYTVTVAGGEVIE